MFAGGMGKWCVDPCLMEALLVCLWRVALQLSVVRCGAELRDAAAALVEEAACVVLRAPLGSAESAGGPGASPSSASSFFLSFIFFKPVFHPKCFGIFVLGAVFFILI